MESVYKTDKGRVRQHNEDNGESLKMPAAISLRLLQMAWAAIVRVTLRAA